MKINIALDPWDGLLFFVKKGKLEIMIGFRMNEDFAETFLNWDKIEYFFWKRLEEGGFSYRKLRKYFLFEVSDKGNCLKLKVTRRQLEDMLADVKNHCETYLKQKRSQI